MQTIHVNASTSYDILIGNSLLQSCGKLIKAVSDPCKAVIVTDDNVNALYQPTVKRSLEEAGFEVDTFVFPHGESSKSHKTLIELYDFLCDCNLTRGDLLIALGGGVVGDLAGYCAATYLRGLGYVQIPTTLLAQIDSSVGGKTAVDTSRGKNLVGAFQQPKLVICDTDTLSTLSDEIFSDGMAEAIKYGLIRDRDLFERIARGDIKPHLEEMIRRCVEIKAQIVEADEFDRGERMLLNFGHTIGHAIERQYHYETYTHGAAVGVGMVYVSSLFESEGITPKGTTEQICACLKKYNLPCAVEITPEQIYTYSVNDKKRNKSQINLIVLSEIGKAEIRKLEISDYNALLQTIPQKEKRMELSPSALSGEVVAPPSKSCTHRALIAAALADGVSKIRNVARSRDIDATLSALAAIGAKIEIEGDTVTITGVTDPPKQAVIDCGESGSTLRFMIPLTAALGIEAEYHGEGRLPERPLSVYHDTFADKGVSFTDKSGMPFTVKGSLTAGKFLPDGNVSSQFVTGLLFALPLLEEDSEIILKTPLASKDYVNITLEILEMAGILITPTPNGYRIKGNQRYRPFSYTVEGDYSQAAFFLVAAAIGDPICCKGLRQDSLQGDRRILEILKLAGANLTADQDGITVSPNKLCGFSIDGGEIPDLIPILSILAACCEGESTFYNIGRLKFKESDRIESTATLLKSLGVSVIQTDDSLTIHGQPSFSGGEIDSYRDHRIAMSAAIAAIRANDPLSISHPDCVNKSFPDFYDKYNQLGGKAHVIFVE